MSYIEQFLQDSKKIIDQLDRKAIDRMVALVKQVREDEGRIFFLGVGGGAGHASHAVNDFRKICGIESYTPADNVSELTARTNDEGWDTTFAEWLKGSRLSAKDAVFVFSVGGGSKEKNISANIVRALEYARQVGAKILGVVGRDGGYTAKVAQACVIIPPINKDTITPQTESFQAFIWHLIVAHPELMAMPNKWESVTAVK